jgi:hypothetical protein
VRHRPVFYETRAAPPLPGGSRGYFGQKEIPDRSRGVLSDHLFPVAVKDIRGSGVTGSPHPNDFPSLISDQPTAVIQFTVVISGVPPLRTGGVFRDDCDFAHVLAPRLTFGIGFDVIYLNRKCVKHVDSFSVVNLFHY